MASPRKILNEHGLAAHKGRGQNFLSDPGAARAIVHRSGLGAGDLVLEIGPGLGALTWPLLEAGCTVVAVEVDQGFVRFLKEELAPRFPERLTIMPHDILKVDLNDLSAQWGRGFHVVGNLPYQISTLVLLKLLDSRDVVTRAVMMFQRELAQRLTAGPGTKAYGRLSVLMGYHARLKRLMELGPEVFYPRPKVSSTLLSIVFKESLEPPLKSESLFRRVVAAGFAQRRKTLKNSLRSDFPGDEALAALATAGIDPARRAETLSLKEFVTLANAWPG